MGWWKKKKVTMGKKKPKIDRGAMLLEDLIECCDGKSNPIKFFSADEIRKATNNFSQSNYLADIDDFPHEWYSGNSENHHMILIKKASCLSKHYREREFCRDIAISSMVSGHNNSLKLLGCCLDFESPVVVYHGVKKHYSLVLKEQPWKTRMKIAEDIATALAYLHTAFPRPFVYRDVSLGNVLLDEEEVTKLRNFSYCVSIPKGQKFVQVDNLDGHLTYMEPNYCMNGVVSEETDVFAIGMLMQRLLVGHRFDDLLLGKEEEEEAKEESDKEDDSYDSATMSKMNDPGRQFSNLFAKFMEKRRIDEIADPTMGEISEAELCQMKAFLMLSHRCIGLSGEVPAIVEVAKELKNIQKCL